MPQAAKSAPRRFIPQVIGAASANVLGSLGAACAGVLVARALGPSGRGVVAGSLAWAGVAALLTSIGLVNAMTYFVARAPSAARSTVRAAVALTLPPSLLVAAAGSVTAYARMDGATALTYSCAFLTIPMSVAGGLHIGALQALRISFWNRARLTQSATYLAAVAALFALGDLTLTTVAVIILGSVAIQLVLARCLLRQLEPKVLVADLPPPPPRRALLTYGLQNLVSALPSTVNARLDQAVLAVAVSSAELGAYAVAISISLLGGSVVAAFGNIAFPRLAAMAEEGERRAMERTALLGSLAVSGLLAVGIIVAAPTIVALLFGTEFSQAVGLTRILAPAGVALSANLVLADLLRARGRPLEAAKAEGVAAVLTVVLLVIFAPRYGAVAAAWISLAAYGLASLLLMARLRLARD